MSKTTADLAIVLLGGTIGSVRVGDHVDVDPEAMILNGFIDTYGGTRGLTIEVSSPFQILSEDANPDHWPLVANEIKRLIDVGHRSIVVSHGTDTMAYTSAALEMVFAGTDARIVLTGAFHNAEHLQSDVMSNLFGAMSTALSNNLEPGVFVAFGDSSGALAVTRGIDLRPMRFDSRKFGSRYEYYVGSVLPDVGFRHYQLADYVPLGNPFILKGFPHVWVDYQAVKSPVFQFTAHPGLDLATLTSGMPAGSIVIVHLYHSGTVYSLDGPGSVTDCIRNRPDINFVLSPMPKYLADTPYASIRRVNESGDFYRYRDLMVHSLYIWFLFGQMAGNPVEDLFAALEDWRVY